jgi:hypothetical protein
MSHYYDRSGASRHEIMGKSTGRMRPTTIKDARENGWLPSVTTVLDILDKPQLTKWKMDQAALAVRRLIAAGRAFPGDDKSFCEIIRKESMQQVTDAADLGTRIHAGIEKLFGGLPYDADLEPYIRNVPALLKEHGIEIDGHELRLVHEELGYAGTTDLAFHTREGLRGILDFKSRKSIPGLAMDAYDGQATQIAAYHTAHYKVPPSGMDRGANVFVSTTEPGRVEIAWHDGATLASEWEFFKHLLRCWQIRNRHEPSAI